MIVSTEVLTVLSQVETDGPYLRITEPLNRKLYEAVNKVLVAAGGKWTSGKTKAHVFAIDAADAIDQVLLTGEITTAQEVGWFPTPLEVVRQMLDLADIHEGQLVLEPSAGEGAIVQPLIERGCKVTCVENDPGRVAALHRIGARQWPNVVIRQLDFLDCPAEALYDRVVMNPPFARQADVEHVTYAHHFLKPGGRLVSVMSRGVEFRQDRTNRAFLDLLSHVGGSIVPLPDDSFKASGTGVRTLLVVLPAS